jgi:hypothetical protein
MVGGRPGKPTGPMRATGGSEGGALGVQAQCTLTLKAVRFLPAQAGPGCEVTWEPAERNPAARYLPRSFDGCYRPIADSRTIPPSGRIEYPPPLPRSGSPSYDGLQ